MTITRKQIEDMAELHKKKALDHSLTQADTLFVISATLIHCALFLYDIRELLAAKGKAA